MRPTRSATPVLLSLLAGVSACSASATIADSVDGGVVDAATVDATEAPDAAVQLCPANDLMIVLDRTGSMAERPDGTMPPNTAAGAAATKWAAAVHTIDAVVAAYQSTVSFGLTLFPVDPDGAGGFDCSNLDTWLAHYLPDESNDLSCQPGQVAVPAGAGTAGPIGDAIDLMTTGLCSFTPIGAGLAAAQGSLATTRKAGRDQIILLITDGDDTCDGKSGYATDSLATTDALLAAGIRTYALGFDGSGEGIDVHNLNDLACAGGTAPSPSSNCTAGGGGSRAIAAPHPAELFLRAEDQQGLTDTLMMVAGTVACEPTSAPVE